MFKPIDPNGPLCEDSHALSSHLAYRLAENNLYLWTVPKGYVGSSGYQGYMGIAAEDDPDATPAYQGPLGGMLWDRASQELVENQPDPSSIGVEFSTPPWEPMAIDIQVPMQTGCRSVEVWLQVQVWGAMEFLLSGKSEYVATNIPYTAPGIGVDPSFQWRGWLDPYASRAVLVNSSYPRLENICYLNLTCEVDGADIDDYGYAHLRVHCRSHMGDSLRDANGDPYVIEHSPLDRISILDKEVSPNLSPLLGVAGRTFTRFGKAHLLAIGGLVDPTIGELKPQPPTTVQAVQHYVVGTTPYTQLTALPDVHPVLDPNAKVKLTLWPPLWGGRNNVEGTVSGSDFGTYTSWSFYRLGYCRLLSYSAQVIG